MAELAADVLGGLLGRGILGELHALLLCLVDASLKLGLGTLVRFMSYVIVSLVVAGIGPLALYLAPSFGTRGSGEAGAPANQQGCTTLVDGFIWRNLLHASVGGRSHRNRHDRARELATGSH